MHDLVAALAGRLVGTTVVTGRTVVSVRRAVRGQDYELRLADGDTLTAEAVVLATPAYVTAALVASLDPLLAEAHAEIPYASTAVVTLAYSSAVLSRPLDGYGYVVPRMEGSDVLACTWTSSKWQGRAPVGHALVRVYMGRFGGRDVTVDSDDELVASARSEIAATLAPIAEPLVACVHRWPRGMPQYVMGSLERISAIGRRLSEHPGLAVAGAAYDGVGIPDCIASGEQAADRIAAGQRSWELAS
jgi:oxygen-dependent protoporphyrinogen oxidase